jgi:hypothetical protein
VGPGVNAAPEHTIDPNWLAAYAIGLAYSSQDLIDAVRRMQDVPGVDRRDLDDARARLRCNLGADEDMLARAGTVLATAAGSLAALG